MQIERRPAELGLVLPPPVPVELPFPWVRVHGDRAYVSGHGPLLPDGALAGPFGKVGGDLTLEEGYQAARLTALAILGSLQRALGDL
ncbi:MAG TPA: RidA family protein, partial [Thermomicrobiales bacterium]|nr:RidA family protein [Thermomicrobiales bacterium]